MIWASSHPCGPSHTPCTPEDHEQDRQVGKLAKDDEEKCEGLVPGCGGHRGIDHHDGDDYEGVAEPDDGTDDESEACEERTFRILADRRYCKSSGGHVARRLTFGTPFALRWM